MRRPNSQATKNKMVVDIGESKRRIGNNAGTGVLLTLEMGRPKYCAPREDIEIVNARWPGGLGEGKMAFCRISAHRT